MALGKIESKNRKMVSRSSWVIAAILVVVVLMMAFGGQVVAQVQREYITNTWREEVAGLYQMIFQASTAELIERIDSVFRPKRRGIGLAPTLEAFDLWNLLLRRECALIATALQPETDAMGHSPIPDLETAWSCWRILQNGRATLAINVSERNAVMGTFLALRRRLGCGRS